MPSTYETLVNLSDMPLPILKLVKHFRPAKNLQHIGRVDEAFRVPDGLLVEIGEQVLVGQVEHRPHVLAGQLRFVDVDVTARAEYFRKIETLGLPEDRSKAFGRTVGDRDLRGPLEIAEEHCAENLRSCRQNGSMGSDFRLLLNHRKLNLGNCLSQIDIASTMRLTSPTRNTTS